MRYLIKKASIIINGFHILVTKPIIVLIRASAMTLNKQAIQYRRHHSRTRSTFHQNDQSR